MWLPRGKIGFSEVARRSGAFSVSRPFNLLTGHTRALRARPRAASADIGVSAGLCVSTFPIHVVNMATGASIVVETGVWCRARGEIFPPPRKPAGARTVLPCASGTGIARRASMSTRARCFASVTLDRYGRRGGASATGERLGARFPRASETSSRAVPVVLRSRPRRTARCLTPRAVMDPTAYPDGRWSAGSHASPGTRRIAQGCVQHPFHSTVVASFIQVTAFRGAGPVSTTPALFIYRTAAAETSREPVHA